MGYELGKDEMAIVLKPMYDDAGELMSFRTGLAIGGSVGDNETEGQLMMDAALSMAAVLMYIQEYPDFEDVLDEYKAGMLQQMYPEKWAEAEAEVEADEQEAKEAYSGNVVDFNIWTKTQGNA